MFRMKKYIKQKMGRDTEYKRLVEDDPTEDDNCHTCGVKLSRGVTSSNYKSYHCAKCRKDIQGPGKKDR